MRAPLRTLTGPERVALERAIGDLELLAAIPVS
jgi:hypothetical protein